LRKKQSADIKKWIHAPSLQSNDRQQFCDELDKIEKLLFDKQSFLDSLSPSSSSSSSQGRRGGGESNILLIAATREEITSLEEKRKDLLNEYWTTFFKQEWPIASSALQQQPSSLFTSMMKNGSSSSSSSWSSPLFQHPSTKNSSPNLQQAAELLAMSRNSTNMHWGGNSPAEDQDAAKRGKKRFLEQSAASAAQQAAVPTQAAAAAMVGLHHPSLPAGFHSTTKTTIVVEPVESGMLVEDGQEAQLIRCNCKKSRCLKLYCECFAARRMCVDDCKCVDCANCQEHAKKREDAIRQVLDRRPDAFHTKVFIATSSNGIQAKTAGVNGQGIVVVEPTAPVALAHARGCSCRRTKCTKKYCVCYNTNVKCGDWCRCVGCENGKECPAEDEAGLGNEEAVEGDEEEEEEENSSSQQPQLKNQRVLSKSDAAAVDALSVLAKMGAAAAPVQAQ
jgi:hypothetical protein